MDLIFYIVVLIAYAMVWGLTFFIDPDPERSGHRGPGSYFVSELKVYLISTFHSVRKTILEF